MGHAIPIEHFLLLLGADAVVLVKKVEKGALGLLQGGIGPGLEISQIREDSLLELLGVLDRTAKGLEPERQASNNVGTRDVKEIVPTTVSSGTRRLARRIGDIPQNARNVFSGGQKESSNILLMRPINRRGDEEVFHYSCQLVDLRARLTGPYNTHSCPPGSGRPVHREVALAELRCSA